MHLSQLQEKICRWHLNAFGAPSGIMNMIAEKIDEECGEFLDAHDSQSKDEIAEELADTAIAILAYASRDEIDLEAAILKKMQTNRDRVYRFENGKFVRDK